MAKLTYKYFMSTSRTPICFIDSWSDQLSSSGARPLTTISCGQLLIIRQVWRVVPHIRRILEALQVETSTVPGCQPTYHNISVCDFCHSCFLRPVFHLQHYSGLRKNRILSRPDIRFILHPLLCPIYNCSGQVPGTYRVPFARRPG